uniref:Putative LAGLIDADG homing endonuclease n=1 Tax=Gloeotilopsis planctonica TaxID=34157 RepID=A0A1B2RZ04_9CHLO|nr:putative LAGLIDADG homing endonuclease [Gloeotilopsis planctonica]
MTQTKTLTYPFLAGLIDGDGHIRSYALTGEIEITMHLEDLALLEQLKNQFEGAIRPVPNKKAARFVLNAKNAKNGKQTLVDLTQGLNGHIRNSVRVEQFKKLCQALNISFKVAEKISNKDGYIAGLFCSDGTIFMNARTSAAAKKLKMAILLEKQQNTESANLQSNNHSQVSQSSAFAAALRITQGLPIGKVSNLDSETKLTEKSIQRILNGVAPVIEVRIANQFLINVENIPSSLGFGVCYFSKKTGRNPRGHFAFHIKSEKDILEFNQYMQKYKNASVKYRRLDLIESFYKLRREGAHLANALPLKKQKWENLIRQWYDPNFACKQKQGSKDSLHL